MYRLQNEYFRLLNFKTYFFFGLGNATENITKTFSR